MKFRTDQKPLQNQIIRAVLDMVKAVQDYAPGFRLVNDPLFSENHIVVLTKVVCEENSPSAFGESFGIVTGAAVLVAEALVDRIKSIKRNTSDYEVLPT